MYPMYRFLAGLPQSQCTMCSINKHSSVLDHYGERGLSIGGPFKGKPLGSLPGCVLFVCLSVCLFCLLKPSHRVYFPKPSQLIATLHIFLRKIRISLWISSSEISGTLYSGPLVYHRAGRSELLGLYLFFLRNLLRQPVCPIPRKEKKSQE